MNTAYNIFLIVMTALQLVVLGFGGYKLLHKSMEELIESRKEKKRKATHAHIHDAA